VTDIDVDGLAYWVELALIQSGAGAATVFLVVDFGAHAAVASSNQLGLCTQPQWQRLASNASQIYARQVSAGPDGHPWVASSEDDIYRGQ